MAAPAGACDHDTRTSGRVSIVWETGSWCRRCQSQDFTRQQAFYLRKRRWSVAFVNATVDDERVCTRCRNFAMCKISWSLASRDHFTYLPLGIVHVIFEWVFLKRSDQSAVWSSAFAQFYSRANRNWVHNFGCEVFTRCVALARMSDPQRQWKARHLRSGASR